MTLDVFRHLVNGRRVHLRFASLGLVFAAAIALGIEARPRAQSKDSSPAERPAPTADSAPAPDAPQTDPSASGGIRRSLTHIPEVFGPSDLRERFGNFSPDVGTWGISGDFSGNSRFGRVNPNAPWKTSGGLTYSSKNGTVAKIGFIGYANYRIPPVMTQMIGSGQDLTLPLASFADLSQQEVQWVLTAGGEKTLMRIPGLATIGAVGDRSSCL